jgi:tetratricopeptide (TPR) repeat protein
MKHLARVTAFAAAIVLALAVAAPAVLAAGDPDPRPVPEPKSDKDKNKKKDTDKKGKKKPDQGFIDGYHKAYALVQAGEYEAAFAAFRALGHDEHPDVANYLGYTARKLGRYDESKVWYERALAADPNHVRTWQYYGMWHVEQGNLLKAQDFLENIHLICGSTTCREYLDLKGAIEGTVSY